MGQYENGVEGQMKTAHGVNVRRFFHHFAEIIKKSMGIPLVFLLFLCPHPHQGFLAGAGALVLRTGSVEAVDKREEELMGGKAVALLYLVVAHVGELVGAVALEAVSPTATRLVCVFYPSS